MSVPRFARKGLLSIVFGTMVAQGLLVSSEAEAQNLPAPASSPATEPQTQASTTLDNMRAHYQRRAPRNVTIGALDTDTLLSFNLNDGQTYALTDAIRSGGVTPDDASVARLAEGLQFYPGIYSANVSVGLEHQTLAPVAVPDLRATDGRAMCITITGQPDIQSVLPTGLNMEQSARFLNRHEFRHCASAHISHMMERHDEIAANVARGEITPALFDYLSGRLEEETRADLGALSDMIVLDGDSSQILRSVAAWRADRMAAEQRDVTHYSSPALLALADRIDAMGIARYRGMSERARERLIERVLQDTKLTGGAVLLVYAEANNASVSAVNYPLSARDHARAAPALAHMRANPNLQFVDMDPIILTPDQATTLHEWDAQGEMAQRAMREGGGQINRFALLAARRDMLDSLRDSIARDPANPIYGARILMTHMAFQDLSNDLAATRLAQQPQTAQPSMAAAAIPGM